MTKSKTDRFASLPEPGEDPVFKMNGRAVADKHPDVVNLVIGAYRDENGRPYPLKAVLAAERMLIDHQPPLDKEYQGIDGHKPFLAASIKMLIGAELAVPEVVNRIASVQAIGGTGAVRIGAELFNKTLPATTPVYISDPTWPNHPAVFKDAGFSDVRTYRYFDPKSNLVAFAELLEDLHAAPNDSIIVFHLCAHNPTGADPSLEQWEQLAELSLQKNFNILFDSAYQGYASGSIDRDAAAARLFLAKGIEFGVAQSFSKNMGLYGERLGCFMYVCGSEHAKGRVTGLLKNVIRPMYSNPPLHGARIAHLLLTDDKLNAVWLGELEGMAKRILHMRTILFDELRRLGTPGSWEHVIKQIGMFSYLGLTKAQCEKLIQDHHIYLLDTSRVSIAGLTEKTAKILAAAIDAVVRAPH